MFGIWAIWISYVAWGATVLYLTLTAARVKADTQPHLGQSLGLTAVLIAAWLLPRVPALAFVNVPPPGVARGILGLVLLAIGLGTLVWARQTLGRNWSQTVSAKVDHELITSGPYAYMRHPMYSGGSLATLGSAIVVGGPFVFLFLVLTPLFLWRTGAEDALLAREFPDSYPAYRARTKRLVPFVW